VCLWLLLLRLVGDAASPSLGGEVTVVVVVGVVVVLVAKVEGAESNDTEGAPERGCRC